MYNLDELRVFKNEQDFNIIAKNNGYPPALMHRLKTKLTNRKRALKQNCTQQQQETTTPRNKLVTFTYFSL